MTFARLLDRHWHDVLVFGHEARGLLLVALIAACLASIAKSISRR